MKSRLKRFASAKSLRLKSPASEGCHARYRIGIRPPLFLAYGLEISIIVDISACNVSGTLRDVCPKGASYIGLDMAPWSGRRRRD